MIPIQTYGIIMKYWVAQLFGVRSIVIVVDVPLLDREHFYVMYNISNFPLPLPARPCSVKGFGLSAKFKLDSEMIAVYKAGSDIFC